MKIERSKKIMNLKDSNKSKVPDNVENIILNEKDLLEKYGDNIDNPEEIKNSRDIENIERQGNRSSP